MSTNMENKEITLEEKQIVSFKEAIKIYVTSGRLWMTIEDDPQDYFYSEGDTFDVPSRKLAVIQALGKSSFWF